MPRVNLVPVEEKRKEFRRRFYIIPVAGAIILVGVLAGSYYYYNSQLDNAQQDLASYQDNNAKLAPQVAELNKYDDQKKQEQARLNSVTSLYQARFRWSRMLDDLTFIIPNSISLIKLTGTVPGATAASATGPSSSASSANRDVELEGYAGGMPDVAIFMVRLGLMPSLKDVTLKLAETKQQTGAPTAGGNAPIHFVIDASLNVQGQQQEPEVAPGGATGPPPVTPTGTTTSPTTPTGTTGTTGGSPTTGAGVIP